MFFDTVTVEDCRRNLLDLGEKALRSVEGDAVAEAYKVAFWRAMKKCSKIFPACISADIVTEVTAHLRLKYGVILMGWLLNNDTGKLPFDTAALGYDHENQRFAQ